MVQKSSRRGRPPEFDREAVIAGATTAFFRTGYEATTLSDLEAATGVDRSTLYNSFGGKRGLYAQATGVYLDNAEQFLFGPMLRGGADGYRDILDFLDSLRTGLTGGTDLPGCLIVNDMAAGSAPEAAARYRRLLEAGLVAALTRAGHPDVDAGAAMLSAVVLGVNLVSKVTADAEEIARVVDAMIATVQDWRAARP